MHLYQIHAADHQVVHVVARTSTEALDLFVTWSAANGRCHSSFTVDNLLIGNLDSEQQVQVHRAFAADLVGIVHFSEESGWTFSAPMWQPLAPDNFAAGASDEGAQ